jgi:RND family efflux transporter MFP subunit
MALRPLLLGLTVLAAALGGCAEPADPAASATVASAPIAVEIAVPELRESVRTLRATGSLLADEVTTLAARVPGRVIAIQQDMGDEVRAGQTLLLLDPTDYALVKAERQLAWEQELARLGLRELPSDDFDLSSLPAVRRAAAQAANAEARYQRGSRLTSSGPPVISEQELDDLRTAAESAAADVELERQAAGATLAQARVLDGQLQIAAQRLSDTVHRVPDAAPDAAYRVAARFVAVGDSVAVGAPLFRLVDTDPLRLRVPMPERHASAVHVGQVVTVHVEGFAEPFTGAVTRIAPEVDTATRTFLTELSLPNPGARLKPGTFASAAVRIASEQVLMAPEACVRTFAGLAKVVRVRDGRAEEARVTLGARAGGWVELLDGVSAEDRLVLHPGPELVTGSPVIERASGGADAGPR